jgi:hypothetical protein
MEYSIIFKKYQSSLSFSSDQDASSFLHYEKYAWPEISDIDSVHVWVWQRKRRMYYTQIISSHAVSVNLNELSSDAMSFADLGAFINNIWKCHMQSYL